MISLFTQKLSIPKIDYVAQTAKKLGINPVWLLAVMYFETAKTFSTSITNKIGSVGLIQFTRDKKGVEYKTIKKKRYYLNDIAKMSFFEQVDLVYHYIDERKGKKELTSFLDVYLVVFFPNAIGKSNDYVLETKNLSRSLIAQQNPVFDKNKDGKITRGEIEKHFSNYFGSETFEIIKKKII